MGYFVRKSITGGFRKTDREDAEYFVQTIDEHEEDIRKIRQAEADRERASSDLEDEISRIRLEFLNNQIAESEYAEKEFRKKMEKSRQQEEKLHSEIDRIKSAASVQNERYKRLEADYQRVLSLKKNLERIARERSNADRSITPKKTHHGFLVLSTSQYQEKVQEQDPDNEWSVITSVKPVWKTVMQTPYDASLLLNEIEPEIRHILCEEVFSGMGVRYVQASDRNGEYKQWEETAEDGSVCEICGVYKWFYKSNFRIGLWELEMYHTMPIFVPEELRPPRKQ